MRPGPLTSLVLVCLAAACSKPQPIADREAACEQLARHLAAEAKPRAVLVLSNPFTQTKGRPAEIYEFDQASLRGIRRAFGDKIPVKQAFPELKPEALQDASSIHVDPQTTTPLSYLVTENAFQKAIAQNPDCNIVISLIGLPLNPKSLPAWTNSGEPVFALLLPDWRMIGDTAAILQSFNTGKLAAAIIQNPASQFVLITRATAPQHFPEDKR